MGLIAVGLCRTPRFAIRAGISSGILWEKESELPGGQKKSIIMGPAMIKAHEVELSQNWLGGAVSLDTNSSVDATYLVKYDVPVKSGCKNPEYALNWPKLMLENNFLETTDILGHALQTYPVLPDDPKTEIASTFQSIGSMDTPEKREKLDNTLVFWDTMANQSISSVH
jgi:hypothetical protein